MMPVVQAMPLQLLKSVPGPAAVRVAARAGTRGVAPSDRSSRAALVVRTAAASDADEIHDLITTHRAEGRLLPRDRAEIAVHAQRFVVVADGDDVVACAELAPLSRAVAEVRSLVVSRAARSRRLGRELVDEVVRRAAAAGFGKLCAFTHSPAYFVQMGFSIVPHAWLPEKIETDCHGCAQFRQCGQYAVILPLAGAPHTFVPLASLRG
jgi:amino-acid N-acetyltransferase